MKSTVCMNGLCGAPSSSEWRKGWALRSGGFANLCDKCGSAYEQLIFCDTFHFEDTGWRECISCGKRLHCGCIASSSLLELLDCGGVKCSGCVRSSQHQPASNNEKPRDISMSATTSNGEKPLTSIDNKVDSGDIDEMNPRSLDGSVRHNGLKDLLSSPNGDANVGGVKEEDGFPVPGEVGTTNSSTFNQPSLESCEHSKTDIHRTTMGIKDVQESLTQTNLTISLSSPSRSILPYPGVVIEERELGKPISSFQQVARSRHLLPRPPKSILSTGLDTNSSIASQIRVARPPAEGRVKNQLLPRYWPRITDQELQQISGDSNSTIVPLFEKVLSASDAGRIGRLVLPKACAEAYFPPISQPEGRPLRIQDVKGKEWVFQFRFWPNNNSRMYVLEGVTPCIQSMQLQAGDTVTFSRMDPEGKLLMGFRKASHALALQSLKGSTEPHLGALQKHMNSTGGDFSWNIMEHGTDIKDGFLPPSERKRSRNIGSKSKRLLMDSQDALELKLTWEEVQDMLRPPVIEEPSVVSIEEHEFEEYEGPPEFAKRSIFTSRSSGGQEQWTQCDSCSKWRRIPVDVLLPSKWTCLDNMWDKSRCSCSVADELNPRELEVLMKLNKDLKKQRMAMNQRLAQQEREPTDPTAATNAGGGHGDNTSDQATPSVATTTRHPRHRPGCSCIVCIQPPSGKGKHKPTCTCNVCMTVKRRFKTLMMRKKKRQSDREAEIAQRNQFTWGNKDEVEVDSTADAVIPSENKGISVNDLQLRCPSNDLPHKVTETGKASLDLNLNCDPEREEHVGSTRVSMMSLLQVASLPLENYLKQNGLISLVSEQQGSSGSHSLPQVTEQSEGLVHEEQESRVDELDQS